MDLSTTMYQGAVSGLNALLAAYQTERGKASLSLYLSRGPLGHRIFLLMQMMKGTD